MRQRDDGRADAPAAQSSGADRPSRAGAGATTASLPPTTAGAGTVQRAARPDAGLAGMPASAESKPTPSGDDPFGFHLLGPERAGAAGGEVPHRGEMESLFGQSFAGVQAATGDGGLASRGIRGQARGDTVAFADAAPSRELVAHELTHVVQQRQAGAASTALATESQPSDAAEVEARAVADQVRGGSLAPVAVRATPSSSIHFEREGDAAPKAGGLPDGVNYEHVPGTMKVRVRSAWLAAGKPADRNLELLQHLRSRGPLAWAAAERLEAAAPRVRLLPEDKAADITMISYPASLYAYIGMPPGVTSSVSSAGSGDGLIIAMSAPDLDLPTGTPVPLSPPQVVMLIKTLEDFTRLAVRPEARASLDEFSFTGVGGPGVFVFLLVRKNLDELFGAEAFQGWLDGHRGTGGADARAVGKDASGLSPDELAQVKAWLAANLPRGADGGTVMDRMLLDLIAEIDASPHRSQILAALTAGDPGAVDARSLRSLVNGVTFEAQAEAAHVKLSPQTGNTEAVWHLPVPARIDQLGGRIISGERVPFRLAIDVPVDLLTPERMNELKFRPFTTSVEWVFEKAGGDTATANSVADAILGQTRGARNTIHHRYVGEDHDPISMSFMLAPHERVATWKATAFVRHSHFEPAIVATELQVRAEDDLLQELEQQAAGDMGVADAVTGPFNFDTGVLNNRLGADGTDLGTVFHGVLPDGWQGRTPAERDQARTRQMDELRSMIAYLREHDQGGGNQPAIGAAERQLQDLARADRAIERDQAEGWQPFEIRGTFLSRAPGVADGPLDLYGMAMQVRRTERPRAYVRDAVGTENEGRTVEKVSIQLRDLTRRFDADDRRTTGEAATFDGALEGAFVTLCKSYPAGQVFVQAQVHDGDLAATRRTLGFELDTGTAGKDLKAAAFDPVVNIAVNLAGMAAMIFVPGSAAIVMPALSAYNTAQTVDQLHTEWVAGTLTAKDLTLGLTSIGLDLLPFLGKAKLIAGSKAGLKVLAGVDLAGEAVFMTTSAHAQATQLQALHVGAMAGLYKQMIELQASTHASDPRLLALQAEFDERAEKVRGATLDAFADMVKQRAVFVAAKHVFHGVQQATAGGLSGPVGKLGDDGAAPQGGVDIVTDPRVTAAGPAHYEAKPADLVDLHANARAAGGEVSPIHIDAMTGRVSFEVRHGDVVTKVEASLPPAITSSASLVTLSNRIVGRPVASIHDGHQILRDANRGDLGALRRLGIDVPPELKLDGIEFGLGELPDGTFVVVRGEFHAVDWSTLPGVKPVAHTHPITEGNHPRQIGMDEITLASTVEARPLVSRALVYPSAADITMMGRQGVKEHLVVTNFEVKDGAAVAPDAGSTADRMEWHILEAVKVGTDPVHGDIFKAHLIGDVGGRPVVHTDVWASAPKDGSDGKLFMASPLRAPAAEAPPARTPAVEVALLRRQADLTSKFGDRLREAGDDATFEVLTADEFVARFDSDKGRAVFVVRGEHPKILARADASDAQVALELHHVDQLDQPIGADIRRLDSDNLADWARRSARDRVEMYRLKLKVEIDAAERQIAEEAGAGDASGQPHSSDAAATLDNLRARQQEVDSLGDDEVAEMSAGRRTLPDYLVQPPWLFTKVRVAIDKQPSSIIETARRVELPPAGADRSPAWDTRADVKHVYQVGDEWRDVVDVSSDHAGTVTVRDDGDGKQTVLVTDASGKAHPYVLEPDARIEAKDGATVKSGHRLATERHRRYRRVEIEHADGSKDRREEILASTGYWKQRGTESTRRGAIMEEAARMQLDARLAEAGVAKIPAGGATEGCRRIKHQRGGGGFDDVVVIFSGTPDEPKAFIRIREVKDYPNRHVPLQDFSAIRPPGLNENLKVLDRSLQTAIKQVDDGDVVSSDLEGLTVQQLNAIRTAIETNSMQIEIVVGPTTKVGHENDSRSTVLGDLRKEIKGARSGADVLAGGDEGFDPDTERVDRAFADVAADRASQRREGAAP